MPSRSIEQLGSPQQIQNCFKLVCRSESIPTELEIIFDIAMRYELFPNMMLSANATCQDYINRWVQNYLNSLDAYFHIKDVSAKGSCNDPMVKHIVKIVTGATEEQATRQEYHHNLYMSAENVQGALLEAYINSVISNYGWVWCSGNTLRAVDFCTPEGNLLQIKNKSNSENSSSSSIRHGTDIKKWYRLGTRISKINGQKVPYFNWDELNDIIERSCGYKCNLNEEDYIDFVERAADNNLLTITC